MIFKKLIFFCIKCIECGYIRYNFFFFKIMEKKLVVYLLFLRRGVGGGGLIDLYFIILIEKVNIICKILLFIMFIN